ncbi:MAG: hypothetical protein J7M19_02655 [Planctomycetes bacterium]|nr:hypothetical protein [Planctomycetota bacterium]
MDEREQELMRDALLSGPEPSGELKARFERQIEDFVRPRLSRAARVGCGVLAAFDFVAAPLFAYGSYSFASAVEVGSFLQFFMAMCFGIASVIFLGTSAVLVYISWSGRSPGPQLRMAGDGVVFVLLLVFMVVMFAKLPDFDLPLKTMILIASVLLFYWTIGLGIFLYNLLCWQRKELLIEQKRLQLEIALLREELARKT